MVRRKNEVKIAPYEQAVQSLKRLFSQKKIRYSLQGLQQSSHSTSQNDRGFWYSKSYPVILHRYNETRPFNESEEAWIEQTAFVFAWIARIPVVRLDRESILQLADLENLFHTSKLWEVGTESYLGGLNDLIIGMHHGERILGAAFGRSPVLIKQFVQHANAIIWRLTAELSDHDKAPSFHASRAISHLRSKYLQSRIWKRPN
ncbi:hypothetical protein [Paenibacillus sp. FSL W8-0194]|uniref:hypothetical protein n=1 Tax=Paenibacillus sp. FSL W8-0194 TaxID=2921711 RepID=UPI0030DA30EF